MLCNMSKIIAFNEYTFCCGSATILCQKQPILFLPGEMKNKIDTDLSI